MKLAKVISIRMNEDELHRLEQAAALGGYRSLSTYIRKQIFNSPKKQEQESGGLNDWAEQQKVSSQLNDIANFQAELQVMVSALLFLAHKKATGNEMSELRAAIKAGERKLNLLDKIAPELGQLMKQFNAE